MQGAGELLLQGAAVAKPGQGIEQGEPTIRQIGANEGGHQAPPVSNRISCQICNQNRLLRIWLTERSRS